MKKEYRETYMGIRMTETEIKELDAYADDLGLNRSQLVRNLIITGLDDLKIAKTFGLISLISFIRQNKIKPQEIINLALEKQGI